MDLRTAMANMLAGELDSFEYPCFTIRSENLNHEVMNVKEVPTQVEEVEISGYVNPRNNDFYPGEKPKRIAEDLFPATLTFQRPKKRRVKRREKVNVSAPADRLGLKCTIERTGEDISYKPVDLYAEWDE